MRGAYLRSDVFYSFCYKSSSRQHPVIFFSSFFPTETYARGVLFVYLFIHFTSEWVGNAFVNQKRFLYITNIKSFRFLWKTDKQTLPIYLYRFI